MVSDLARGRLAVVVALLLLAFGVLTMHLMSEAGAPHGDHAAHHCRNGQDGHGGHECPPAPMHHLGAMCAAAVMVVVAVLALVRARRGVVSMPPVSLRRSRPDLTVRAAAPALATLCVLRC